VRRALPALLIAAGLALTGCGGKEEAPATSAAPTTEAAETASPEAWSAWAVRNHANLDGWDDDWSDLRCGSPDGDALMCGLTINTWKTTADTLRMNLDMAMDEGHDKYLGPVSDGQKHTVDEIDGSIDNVIGYGETWESLGCSGGGDDDSLCHTTAGLMKSSMQTLDDALTSLE
jgi:uncharacterized protein YceK